ncbi:hypothetical protein D1872_35820 [compost metagenome]
MTPYMIVRYQQEVDRMEIQLIRRHRKSGFVIKEQEDIQESHVIEITHQDYQNMDIFKNKIIPSFRKVYKNIPILVDKDIPSISLLLYLLPQEEKEKAMICYLENQKRYLIMCIHTRELYMSNGNVCTTHDLQHHFTKQLELKLI